MKSLKLVKSAVFLALIAGISAPILGNAAVTKTYSKEFLYKVFPGSPIPYCNYNPYGLDVCIFNVSGDLISWDIAGGSFLPLNQGYSVDITSTDTIPPSAIPITVYDSNGNLVYDGLVNNKTVLELDPAPKGSTKLKVTIKG